LARSSAIEIGIFFDNSVQPARSRGLQHRSIAALDSFEAGRWCRGAIQEPCAATMFSLLSGLVHYIFSRPEFFALVIGLDNAGKTVSACWLCVPAWTGMKAGGAGPCRYIRILHPQLKARCEAHIYVAVRVVNHAFLWLPTPLSRGC